MRNAQSRRASGGLYALAFTFSGLVLASCTSSSDPNLDLNSTAFNSASMTAPTGAAGSDEPADKPQAQPQGEGDAASPGEVAFVPATRPTNDAAQAAAREESSGTAAGPAATEASKPLPPNIASTQRDTTAASPPALTASASTRAAPAAQAFAPIATSTRSSASGAAPRKPLFGKLFGAAGASGDVAAPVLHEQPVKPVINEDPGKAFIENVPPKTFVENLPDKPLVNFGKPSGNKPVVLASLGEGGNGLPGVRVSALFEIKRKSGIDDDSDVDVHEEDDAGGYQVASAAGMARLAPNGLLKQTESVDVACLKPSLVRVLKTVESRYNKKLIVTSGYRSRIRNIQARGAKNSMHMYCAAADIQVPGVSKIDLANFLRAMPGRGGVGTYCHTNSVHIDVGPERDWNWNCRRRGS